MLSKAKCAVPVCCMGSAAAEGGLQVCSSVAGGRNSLNGDVDKFVDVLGAAPATTVALEIEFGLQLAGHDQPRASCLADIRFGNSLAEAHIHGLLLPTIMRSIISIGLDRSFVNPPRVAP